MAVRQWTRLLQVTNLQTLPIKQKNKKINDRTQKKNQRVWTLIRKQRSRHAKNEKKINKRTH